MNTESLIRCLQQCSEDKNNCEQCERYEKNVGSMRCVDNLLAEAAEAIKSLNADLKENNRIAVQLRKQWQDAEMFICTMCGHFDHKTDGNIVYGNQDCGEIVGYPYCKKFTPWISVADRLPEKNSIVIAAFTYAGVEKQFAGVVRFTENDGIPDWEHIGMKISHWMPMPELPKESYK